MLVYIFGVPAYPIFFALGLIAGGITAAMLARRSGVAPHHLIPVILLAAGAMLLGGKLHSLVERGAAFSPLSAEISSGYRYAGGLAFSLVALAWAGRVRLSPFSFAQLGDLFAPAFCFASVTIRIGCFLSGCCYGTVTAMPWAVEFPAQTRVWHAHLARGWIDTFAATSLPVHPLQLYLAGACLLVGGILLVRLSSRRYDGQLLFLYLLLHGSAKFFIEFFLDEPHAGIQIFSAIMAAAGATGLAMKASAVQARR